MTANARTINDVAAVIRADDGANTITPGALGDAVSNRLDQAGFETARADVVAFVERTNGDKRCTPERLAELIVAEFNLDKE